LPAGDACITERGWVGDVLFHNRGIDRDALEIIALHRPGTLPGLDRLSEQPFNSFFADPVTPAGQGRRIKRQAVLKEGLAAEMLPIRVLGPPCHDCLV
jgi:hypothetical protein